MGEQTVVPYVCRRCDWQRWANPEMCRTFGPPLCPLCQQEMERVSPDVTGAGV